MFVGAFASRDVLEGYLLRGEDTRYLSTCPTILPQRHIHVQV